MMTLMWPGGLGRHRRTGQRGEHPNAGAAPRTVAPTPRARWGLRGEARAFPRVLLATLLLLSAATTAAAAPSSDPADAPRSAGGEVLLLPLDADDNDWSARRTHDRSGHANHGDLFLMSPADVVPARHGQGLAFEGASRYVLVKDAPSLRPSAGITIAAWVRLDSFGGSERGTILEKLGSGYGFRVVGGTQHALAANVTGSEAASDAGVVVTGQFQHVAVVYDGARITFFVNGFAKGSVAASGPVRGGTGDLRIGNGKTLATGFDGVLDDVRIWGRALSASELASIADCPYSGPARGTVVNAKPDGLGARVETNVAQECVKRESVRVEITPSGALIVHVHIETLARVSASLAPTTPPLPPASVGVPPANESSRTIVLACGTCTIVTPNVMTSGGGVATGPSGVNATVPGHWVSGGYVLTGAIFVNVPPLGQCIDIPPQLIPFPPLDRDAATVTVGPPGGTPGASVGAPLPPDTEVWLAIDP